MRLHPLTVAALSAGSGAAITTVMYLAVIPPLNADLGIQVTGALLLIWIALTAVAFARHGRGAWPALMPGVVALAGPALLALLIVGCAVNTTNCP